MSLPEEGRSRDGPAPRTSPAVTYIGHSTLALDMNGLRVLTDPLLRNRVAHLYRRAPTPSPESYVAPDVVLISHLHLDHLDLPSLRRLGQAHHLIVPSGARRFMQRRGFAWVDELKPGESARVGALTITAVQAEHSGFRPPLGPTGVPVGFIVAGERRMYFAGDTDLFPEMADIAGQVDIALMPVAGWGPSVGKGHLDPRRAAEALTLLQPAVAIPIHWGTFTVRGTRVRDRLVLMEPALQFAEEAARLAPDVTVRILEPGQRAGFPSGR